MPMRGPIKLPGQALSPGWRRRPGEPPAVHTRMNLHLAVLTGIQKAMVLSSALSVFLILSTSLSAASTIHEFTLKSIEGPRIPPRNVPGVLTFTDVHEARQRVLIPAHSDCESDEGKRRTKHSNDHTCPWPPNTLGANL